MKKFRQRYRTAIGCVVLLFFLLHSIAHAQSIEDRLERQVDQFQAVGLAVAVVKDNEIIYTNSFGWKDKEAEIPLELHDLFRIASISKSFSAIAIMQLLEQGKLSLDDDVSDLIGFPVRNPNFPDKTITLEMLLTHTSSLLDSEGYGNLDIINPRTNEDWAESYAEYAPGEQYEYCNLGYNTIGAIIEQVSGQRFDQYIKKNILDPLGLYGGYLPSSLDTTRFAQIYRYDHDRGIYNKSQAYRNLESRLEDYKMGYSAATLSPTGGMKISAPDLAKYMLMHMNNGRLDDVQIMSSESAKEMRKPKARIDSNTHYGYALRSYKGTMIPGVDLIGHTGSAYGLNSGMMFDADKKYGLVFISNGFIPADPDFRSHVLAELYDYFIDSTATQPIDVNKTTVNIFSLTLEGHANETGQGNFVDIKRGKVFTLEEASAAQSQIDLLYTYGKSTGANLMVPASKGIQYFGDRYKEKVFKAWRDKNMGKLLVLDGTGDNKQFFNDIQNNLQLTKAYEMAVGEIENKDCYKRLVQGPNARIHSLKPGDLVFLVIPSRENGILSLIDSRQQEILAVGHINRIEDGSSGEIQIDFKVASQ